MDKVCCKSDLYRDLGKKYSKRCLERCKLKAQGLGLGISSSFNKRYQENFCPQTEPVVRGLLKVAEGTFSSLVYVLCSVPKNAQRQALLLW